MKTPSLILIFISICQFSFSQDYIIDYFPHTNKAESFIINDNYQDALLNYETAFKLNGFGKDYFNAAICATETQNIELASKYILILADKGLSLEALQKNRILNELIQKLPSKFNNDYAERFNKFYTQKNYKLEEKLNYLVSEDQKLRGYENSYTDDNIMSQILKIDSSNVGILLKTIDSAGFPSESQLGLCDSVNYTHDFDLVIWHQAFSSEQIYNFETVIKKAIKDGRIYQDYGAYLIEKCNGTSQYASEVIYKITPVGKLKAKYNPKEFKEWRIKNYIFDNSFDHYTLNNQRRAIGLRPLSEYIELLKYCFKKNTNNFVLLPRVLSPQYQIEDEESFKINISISEILKLDE